MLFSEYTYVGLPTCRGISFVSRKYARVRYEDASPGTYFVMVESIDDVGDFSFIVSIDRLGDEGDGGGAGDEGGREQNGGYPVVRPVWSHDVDREGGNAMEHFRVSILFVQRVFSSNCTKLGTVQSSPQSPKPCRGTEP